MLRAVCISVFLGCGGQLATPEDAGTSDADVAELLDGAACHPNAPFGAPHEISIDLPVVSSYTASFSLAADGTAWFTVQQQSELLGVWTASRTDAYTWSGSSYVFGKNDGSYWPTVTPDKHLMVYERDTYGLVQQTYPFGVQPTVLYCGSTTCKDAGFGGLGQPCITHDGLVLYAAGVQATQIRPQIFRMERATIDAPFSVPSPLGELATDDVYIGRPIVTPDEQTIVYSHPNPWTATRTDKSLPFSNMHAIGELPTNTEPLFLTPDGCTLYFTNILGGFGDYPRLFSATRQ